ncbi:uncharacterized protein LOC133867744 isoform X1 [Alnus glutinosa]|uniref:uncharacterized protein LOC133867744 isoform X1 n=1 Tax=Alnus glutinosa TaxID=3517 RepID=UPI002D775CDD|nr:uncharacterized protein LOC133867744 isoform X1 [Alnus glutinosa]XP_062160494.1 uncharacterized protein LOC133867744 isoform X1 [Alnus glutinosa]
MEALHLLCSIVSTTLTSLALSLLLLFRTLLPRKISSRAVPSTSSSATSTEAVSLYEGTVWHERRRPVHHSFRYSVRYALFDLDCSPHAPPDHLSANQARQIAATTGPILLLTIPPSVGYEQNPLSLYYCYDVEGSTQCLKKCIAEVTNTPWGERVSFVFNPNTDLVAKPLHVSPFMDMLGTWRIRANAPGENLYVAISVQHPKLGDYFTATLKAKRVPSSLVSDHAMFFWLMPHMVAVWIYWHAVKLWWKNVSFLQHPRYTNPAYREEAVIRDQKLQRCPIIGSDKDEYLQDEGSDQGCLPDRNCEIRQFTWRDAKWPWS